MRDDVISVIWSVNDEWTSLSVCGVVCVCVCVCVCVLCGVVCCVSAEGGLRVDVGPARRGLQPCSRVDDVTVSDGQWHHLLLEVRGPSPGGTMAALSLDHGLDTVRHDPQLNILLHSLLIV